MNAQPPAQGVIEPLLELFEHTSDGIIIADAAGCVLWSNPALFDLCGYTADELLGRRPGDLLQGPDTDPAAVAELHDAIAARRPCSVELVNYHKDTSPYWVSIQLTPLANPDTPARFAAIERKVHRPQPAARPSPS